MQSPRACALAITASMGDVEGNGPGGGPASNKTCSSKHENEDHQRSHAALQTKLEHQGQTVWPWPPPAADLQAMASRGGRDPTHTWGWEPRASHHRVSCPQLDKQVATCSIHAGGATARAEPRRAAKCILINRQTEAMSMARHVYRQTEQWLGSASKADVTNAWQCRTTVWLPASFCAQDKGACILG